MKVINGSASRLLAKRLAECFDGDPVEVTIKRFPDGECYLRIMEDLAGEDVVLVQSSYPDENIVELFILQDAVRKFKPASLTTVIPYFGYARQDKEFNVGEALSADTMARHISLGCDKVICVDLHEKKILDWFTVEATQVSGMPALADHLRDLKIDLVIGPDKGAMELADMVADELDCPRDYLEKTRIDGSTVEIAPKSIDVQGKTIAITDDIIATGGTIIQATKQLKAKGCLQVHAACTHGLYTGGAIPKLKEVCDSVISTDTLENETSVVTVAGELKKALS